MGEEGEEQEEEVVKKRRRAYIGFRSPRPVNTPKERERKLPSDHERKRKEKEKPTSNRSDHRALLLRLLTLNHVDLVCRTFFSFQLYRLTTNFISSSVSEKILSPSSKERVDRNVTRKATVDDPLSSRTPPSLAQADVKHNLVREITHG